jgi:clan AA aspartic protease
MRNTKREQMGEVHVRVRLSNAVDVTLVQEGELDSEEVRTCEVDAMIDTGATRSLIPQDVFEKLGLSVLREATGILADGTRIPTPFSSGIVFELEGRMTIEGAYVLGDSVLIGQTVLESTDLLVDCKNHKVIAKHPEGPVHRL